MTLKLGYARVSTDKEEDGREQTLEQQIDRLTEAGVASENIYAEKVSGRTNLTKGAQWRKLRDRALDTEGPVEIVVVSWSRVSRDALKLQNVVAELGAEGVCFTVAGDPRYQQHVVKDAMDGLVLAFEAFGAQLQREHIASATKAKLQFLKSQGVKLGRPTKLDDDDKSYIREKSATGWGAARIAKELSTKRLAAIPAEQRLNPKDFARAVSHAKVSKPLIGAFVRLGAENDE